MALQSVSNLKRDERIVFVTTDAYQSADRNSWSVPIHAWVHEFERARIRIAAVAAAFRLKHGLQVSAESRQIFQRRVRLIVADNERGKRLVIRVAGQEVTLPATAPNGHVRHEVQLAADVVREFAIDGALLYTAVLPQRDDREFTGRVRLVGSEGVSILSDFDDTVKTTFATDRTMMLDHTFYRDFESVPGMALLYTAWATEGAEFHFVSSSPWHLYEPIVEFLQTAGFPDHSVCLRHFRFKDATLFNLLQPGTVTKPRQIDPILKAFPSRRFIFVGDSGQHDPEVYAAFARDYPEQIVHICIRNITDANREDERMRMVFHGVPAEKWTLFDHPRELLPLYAKYRAE